MITKIFNFLRWLFASETLPADVVEDVRGVHAPRRSFIRWLLKASALGSGRAEDSIVAGGRSFLVWIAATETLPVLPTESEETPRRSPRFWSWLVLPESLPETGGGPSPASARTMFFRRLIEPETCPTDWGVAAPRRAGLAQILLASEECPNHPEEAGRRERGWVGWLLEAEECPVVASPTSVRCRGFLRNLLAQEEL